MTSVARRDWYTIEKVGHGITVIQEWFTTEDVKTFLIEGERDVAVLDTGYGVGDFAGLVARLSSRDPLVLHSHAHWDHIGDSHRFERVLVHPSEADDLRRGEPHESYITSFGPGRIELDRLPESFDPETACIPGTEPTGWIIEGDRFDVGGRVLEAFHTPGHTPGGITLLDHRSRTLFPGDAIALGVIHLMAPNSDPAGWRDTIGRLAELAARADVIRPAHGPAMTPDDVRDVQRAYEEVWIGRAPDDQGEADIGMDEPARYDVHRFERFSFLLATGRYGAAAAAL
jgi:glyoxylase-like metal-dependent hydrolase (beta-lactamase superfamily II)